MPNPTVISWHSNDYQNGLICNVTLFSNRRFCAPFGCLGSRGNLCQITPVFDTSWLKLQRHNRVYTFHATGNHIDQIINPFSSEFDCTKWFVYNSPPLDSLFSLTAELPHVLTPFEQLHTSLKHTLTYPSC